MSDCGRLIKYLSDYIDLDLERSICRKIEAHRDVCRTCRDFLFSLEKTVRLMRTSPKQHPPSRMRNQLRKRLRKVWP